MQSTGDYEAVGFWHVCKSQFFLKPNGPPLSHFDNSIIFTPWDSSSKFAVIWLWVEGCWMTQMNVAQSKQTCKSLLARDRERKTWEEQKKANLQDETLVKSHLARITKFSPGCSHQKLGAGFARVFYLWKWEASAWSECLNAGIAHRVLHCMVQRWAGSSQHLHLAHFRGWEPSVLPVPERTLCCQGWMCLYNVQFEGKK